MVKTLYVINPNSNTEVTSGIDAAMAVLRSSDAPKIECVTLTNGPPGIQTQRDVDNAAVLVREFAEQHKNEAAGFVTACFSDPGLHSLREIKGLFSMGISEGAVLTAMTLGNTFGVIAMAKASIPRHLRTWAAMGISSRVAGEVAIGRTVAELSNVDATLSAMISAGKTLRDEYRADVLVMGCAGMSRYKDALQEAVCLPVVEPSLATVSMVIGRVRLGW